MWGLSFIAFPRLGLVRLGAKGGLVGVYYA